MDDEPASLLTKKQRERIRDGFADLNDQQQRRDQQQIRDRVRAGVFDFQILSEYSDRQLKLAFDDVPEEELKEALANAMVFVDRVRVLEEFDRNEVQSQARIRVDDVAARSDDVQSLEEVDLRTRDEIRRESRAALRNRLEDNPWDERADGLLKLAMIVSLPLFGVLLANAVTSQNLITTMTSAVVTAYLSALAAVIVLGGALLIKVTQAVKHDLIPAVRKVRRNPTGILRTVAGWLRRPSAKLRQVWDDL